MTSINVSLILNEFIALQTAAGNIQHSPEWHAARATGIGGSSAATVLGLNPYQSRADFIRERALSTTKFKVGGGNTATSWGNLFEKVLRDFAAAKLGSEIVGHDIFTRYSDTLYYSPDGFAVVDNKIILMEFKCPFSRLLTDAPPAYYIPQVKSGLGQLEFCDHAVFVESVIRRCTWDQLDNTMSHEPLVTKTQYGRMSKQAAAKKYNCLRAGVIFLYRVDGESLQPIDFGGAQSGEFEAMLDSFVGGRLTAEYISIDDNNIINLKRKYDDELVKRSKEPLFYGYVPWKILDYKTYKIERDLEFFEQLKSAAADCCNEIKNYSAAARANFSDEELYTES